MKIPNKRELQQIAINHSSDIEFKDFIKIHNKCTDKSYSFLVNDTTLSSDNPLRFRKNLYNIQLKMTIDNKIRDEKLQYDINREAAKISALSSNKIHKYEYLTGEEILPSNKKQIIEQARFTCSPLGKAFDKQIKTIEDLGKKQVDTLNTLKSDEKLTIEDKSNNKSKATTIFNELINKRKEIMNELYDSVDYNKLKFEYVGLTKDVSY